MAIENFLFEVSDALRWPVLIFALAALAWALVEVGILLAEMWKRRWRSVSGLETAVDSAAEALGHHDNPGALAALAPVSWNRSMFDAMTAVIVQRDLPDAEARISKRLAEYDYRSLRRLERTRVLVRMGPALGLMGTLIPLSPALGGLADGNVTELTDNLRVAFGVTVAGLLTGAIAFSVSLVRDRIYAQDYSDVEYASVTLAPDRDFAAAVAQRQGQAGHHHMSGYGEVHPTEHGGSTSISMGNP